jgi:membrane-associated protease RseP (regulator of RpoE activity)
LVPSRPPLPGTLGALRPPLLNVLLFLLTFGSAFLAGTWLTGAQHPEPTEAETLRQGLGFALALLFIMLAHEMGHFLLARKHGVDATWPFFIPAPFLSLIGTLGAVIRLRSLPKTRRALLDIGASGPIAGFLATLPVLVLGLHWSKDLAGRSSTPCCTGSRTGPGRRCARPSPSGIPWEWSWSTIWCSAICHPG